MEEKIEIQVVNGDGSLGNKYEYLIDEAKENTIPSEGIKVKLLAIKKLSDQINREICSSKYTEWSNKNWNSFQIIITALDTIDDCSDAIINYIDMKEEEYKKFSRLSLYGILQAIYMQQDAINFLNRLLRIKTKRDESYDGIRDIRNHISGHPISNRTEKEDEKYYYYFLGKGSHEKWSFEYAAYTPKFDRKKINLRDSLETHIGFVINSLERIESNLDYLLKEKQCKTTPTIPA
ncbi:MAG: hypothetical protein IKY79_08320 [Bacteroidales bacterium]|nr:hypothetical protein [Bacteroidales bacterium]